VDLVHRVPVHCWSAVGLLLVGVWVGWGGRLRGWVGGCGLDVG
jgi:hypothetical protein